MRQLDLAISTQAYFVDSKIFHPLVLLRLGWWESLVHGAATGTLLIVAHDRYFIWYLRHLFSGQSGGTHNLLVQYAPPLGPLRIDHFHFFFLARTSQLGDLLSGSDWLEVSVVCLDDSLTTSGDGRGVFL